MEASVLTRGLALLVIVGSLIGSASCSRPAPQDQALPVAVRFGEAGDAPGQFGYPRGLDADPGSDSLWVIDKLARVQRLDPRTGRAHEVWRTPKFDRGKPTGLTAWRSTRTGGPGWLFIADTHEHRVLLYRLAPGAGVVQGPDALASRPTTPTPTAMFGSYGTGDGQFIYPTDVAVLATPEGADVRRIYVSEYGGNDRVSIFDALPADASNPAAPPSFRFVRTFGRFGSGDAKQPLEFSRPQSMTLDIVEAAPGAALELLIADACNHRIGRFTLEGDLIRWIAGPESAGDAPGAFSYPYSLASLGDGTAMVAEFGNNRLQRIDLRTGQSLGLFGRAGRSEGQLSTPWALSTLDGRVFVLDSGNSRVQAFDAPRGRPRPIELAQDQRAGGTR